MRYHLYTLAFPFDLRCESITYIILYILYTLHVLHIMIYSMVFKKMKTVNLYENMWNILMQIKLVFLSMLSTSSLEMIADYTGRTT